MDRNIQTKNTPKIRKSRSPQGERGFKFIVVLHIVAGAGVALRKESVDRNRRCVLMILQCPTSLSARRAWIEIISALV